MHAGTPEPLSIHTHTHTHIYVCAPERTARGQACPFPRLGLWNIATAVAAACARSLREGPRVLLLPIGKENLARGCFAIDRMLFNALRSSSRALLRALFSFPDSPLLFPRLLFFSPFAFYSFTLEDRSSFLPLGRRKEDRYNLVKPVVSFIGVWGWRRRSKTVFNCKSMRRERVRDARMIASGNAISMVGGGSGFDERQGSRWSRVVRWRGVLWEFFERVGHKFDSNDLILFFICSTIDNEGVILQRKLS